MNRKLGNYALVAGLMVGSFALGVGVSPLKVKAETTGFATFLQVYDLVKGEYVEPKVDDTQLDYGAIRGMLASLNDPYTRFMDPKAFQGMHDERSGSFGGIGIQIGIKDKQLTVIAPIEDTPAFKAGLKAGDAILAIDGKLTKDMAETEAVDLIRGEKGTPVTLKIMHKGGSLPTDVKITRGDIVTKPVITKELKGNIGYIRLSTFMDEHAADDMKTALLKFKNKSGLILDLRGNPGGLLTNAIDIGSMFIKSGPIVQVVNREGKKQYYDASGSTIVPPTVPVAVLVDGGSASASEILSGALKDTKRGTLIGVTTFGKGLVQTVHQLSDGSGVAITTNKYLTAGGHYIHHIGILPNIKVELPKIKLDKQGNPLPGELKKLKDTQLDAAELFIDKQIAHK
jgi:carboxyl-terminal processing protease